MISRSCMLSILACCVLVGCTNNDLKVEVSELSAENARLYDEVRSLQDQNDQLWDRVQGIDEPIRDPTRLSSSRDQCTSEQVERELDAILAIGGRVDGSTKAPGDALAKTRMVRGIVEARCGK